MNRVLILTGVFPPDIGGPTAQLDALSRELVKNNYTVRVLTYGKSDEQYPYPVKRISKKIPFPFKSLIYLITGLILAFRADIVYSWDLYTAGLTGLAIKKILGKKVVNRFVGDSAWEKAALQKSIGQDDVLIFQDKKYSKKIERWKERRKKILINSDKVIVVSNFLKKVALKIGVPEEKIEVIYNSVDVIDAVNSDDGDLNEKTLLTSARLTPWKGVDMLIEIMQDLDKRHRGIRLVVVGDGPELKRLKNLAKGLNVIFKGKLSRMELIKCMQSADIFLLNTNYEGLSHTILEAMKIGLPVITTKAGGNPETVADKETGLLVDYGNKKEWLEAIDLLLDNPDLARKMASRAKESLDKFNWDSLVKKTINVFEEICQKSS
jgi:glycosyltransferase involved in cell wall biosynthesis